MTYDAVGNLTTDTYSGSAVTRVYDTENRMTSETQAGGLVAGVYTYNAESQRVRRKVSGVETWQIYGFGSELLAEYAASGAATSPQKEYGYRNGQLLVTAEPAAQIKWLVADHLGTPRLIADKTGSLAGIRRHDYLPFGEELFAGTGGRTIAKGYSGDNIRHKFTSKERDIETVLDYFGARYYASLQGRFTSPDDPFADWSTSDPQRWNLYSYTSNNPLGRIDADGERWARRQRADGKWEYQWFDHLDKAKDGTTAYDRALASGWSEVSEFPLIVTEDGTGRRLLLNSTDGGRTPTVDEISKVEEVWLRYQINKQESADAWEKWWDLPGLERELDALPMTAGSMKATRAGGHVAKDVVRALRLRGLSLTSGMKKLRELGFAVRMTKTGRREFYDTVTGAVRAAWDAKTSRGGNHWHKFARDGKTPLNDAGRVVDKKSTAAHIPSK